MTTALEKIVSKNEIAAEKQNSPPAVVAVARDRAALNAAAGLVPCPTCDSAIRWLNAAGVARCIGCQPPKMAALVRSREILVLRDQATDERAWECVIEAPDGRLVSETGIRRMAEKGELPEAWRGLKPHLLPKASGVGVGVDSGAAEFDAFVEIDPAEEGLAAKTGGRLPKTAPNRIKPHGGLISE